MIHASRYLQFFSGKSAEFEQPEEIRNAVNCENRPKRKSWVILELNIWIKKMHAHFSQAVKHAKEAETKRKDEDDKKVYWNT